MQPEQIITALTENDTQALDHPAPLRLALSQGVLRLGQFGSQPSLRHRFTLQHSKFGCAFTSIDSTSSPAWRKAMLSDNLLNMA